MMLDVLLYAIGAVLALMVSGFFFYYAGRLVGLGVMRSIYEAQDNRLGRRT